jgi:hypothetical protein
MTVTVTCFATESSHLQVAYVTNEVGKLNIQSSLVNDKYKAT